jgi:hypothetical protein
MPLVFLTRGREILQAYLEFLESFGQEIGFFFEALLLSLKFLRVCKFRDLGWEDKLLS